MIKIENPKKYQERSEIMPKTNKSLIDLLNNIEDEFNNYAATLEDDSDFLKACAELRERLEKIEKAVNG